MKHIALVLALLMIVNSANALQTAILKDIIKNGDINRTGIKHVNFDDGTMKWANKPGYEKGTSPIADAYGVPKNAQGEDWCLVVGPEWQNMHASLIGLYDLFNLLPESTIDERADIRSATFRIRQRGPTGGEILGVYRVTSPWLVQAAGSNETTANAVYALPGGENRYWAADVGKTMVIGTAYDETNEVWYEYEDWSAFVGFSAADYTTEDGQSFTIVDTAARTGYDVDVTEIVRDWYSEGNQGLVVLFENDTWSNSNAPYFNDSESNSTWYLLPDGSSPGIELIITYTPEPTTIGLLAIGGVAALIRRKR